MIFPLVSNEKVKNTVNSFIALSKIPHAVLITGDEGTGKHTLADFLSTAAVCSGKNKPCGVCHGCKMAAAKSHPDIITVSRESGKKELGVGIIREMRSDAFIKPHEADKKVYIIENAESMNATAQNALLKVLEEPPEYVIFILLASNKAALLPTVISRCTWLSLSAAEIDEATEVLMKIAETEEEAARNALILTHGNIGAAKKLLNENSEQNFSAVADDFILLTEKGDCYGILKLLSQFEKNRLLAEKFLLELKIKIAEKIKTLPKNGSRAKTLFAIYSKLGEYSEHLKSNVNLPLLFCQIAVDINEYRG